MSRTVISEGKSFLFDGPIAYGEDSSGYISHRVIEIWNEFSEDHRMIASLGLHDSVNTSYIEFCLSEDDDLATYENNIKALQRVSAAVEEIKTRIEEYKKRHVRDKELLTNGIVP